MKIIHLFFIGFPYCADLDVILFPIVLIGCPYRADLDVTLDPIV